MSIQSDSSQVARGKVQMGDPAPDFTLPSITGKPISLSSFIGQKDIVLYFYPKGNWTPVNIG